MDTHTATTVLGLVNSTVQAAKNAVDLAKNSKDSELKQKLSDVIDGLLELKIKVLDLEESNRSLQQRLDKRQEVVRESEFGYWFKVGETGPLCPKCYEGTNKLVYLPPSEAWNGGIRRHCRICSATYWEKPMDI